MDRVQFSGRLQRLAFGLYVELSKLFEKRRAGYSEKLCCLVDMTAGTGEHSADVLPLGAVADFCKGWKHVPCSERLNCIRRKKRLHAYPFDM